MGCCLACICCYCCLQTFRPKTIEFTALGCNILEIVFMIWGIAGIPWGDISIGGKVFFSLSCVFIILSLIFLIALMRLRCQKKINTSKNSTGKCLCISDIIFDILAELLIIISEFIIISNMNDKDDKIG